MEKSTEVEQNRKQITVEQEEAEESLRQALPDLENARAALDSLQKKDITEIRSFMNPPESVQIICECVAILKGFKDISWKTAKQMLADTSFLKSLQEMNCDLITVKQITSCRAHMKVNYMHYYSITEYQNFFELPNRKPQKWMKCKTYQKQVTVY
jgi:dynein heavy chain, axonemal